MAATLIFLQIKDAKGRPVVGESTAANHVEQIEVESFSWGMKADHSPKAGGQVSTQVQYDKLEIVKHYDRATTALCQMMSASSGGKVAPLPFDSATLSLVDIVFGDKESAGVPVLEIRLQDGFVEDIRLSATESGKTMQIKETVTLSFQSVKLSYYTASTDRAARGKAFYFEGESSSQEA